MKKTKKYTKETHIELSDGSTKIVSYRKCPLLKIEIKEIGNTIEIDEKEIVVCDCYAYFKPDCRTVKNCPHYYGMVYSKGRLNLDCRK